MEKVLFIQKRSEERKYGRLLFRIGTKENGKPDYKYFSDPKKSVVTKELSDFKNYLDEKNQKRGSSIQLQRSIIE